MPSTEDATLQLIQREISEVVLREKELKEFHSRSSSRNGHVTPNYESSGSPEPPLERTQSMTSLFNGHHNFSSSNGTRIFAQNPSTKGVMQRFIKSRGRISTLAAIARKKQEVPTTTWASTDNIETPRAIVPAGMQPRNGFIPIEERIRREFNEMQERETELRIERQKSQPDLLALLNNPSPEPERKLLRSIRSVSQLSDDAYEETTSAPASLKPARSLADLCDVNDDEDDDVRPPGSLTLIKQWETLIQKNQPSHS